MSKKASLSHLFSRRHRGSGMAFEEFIHLSFLPFFPQVKAVFLLGVGKMLYTLLSLLSLSWGSLYIYISINPQMGLFAFIFTHVLTKLTAIKYASLLNLLTTLLWIPWYSQNSLPSSVQACLITIKFQFLLQMFSPHSLTFLLLVASKHYLFSSVYSLLFCWDKTP